MNMMIILRENLFCINIGDSRSIGLTNRKNGLI